MQRLPSSVLIMQSQILCIIWSDASGTNSFKAKRDCRAPWEVEGSDLSHKMILVLVFSVLKSFTEGMNVTKPLWQQELYTEELLSSYCCSPVHWRVALLLLLLSCALKSCSPPVATDFNVFISRCEVLCLTTGTYHSPSSAESLHPNFTALCRTSSKCCLQSSVAKLTVFHCDLATERGETQGLPPLAQLGFSKAVLPFCTDNHHTGKLGCPLSTTWLPLRGKEGDLCPQKIPR